MNSGALPQYSEKRFRRRKRPSLHSSIRYGPVPTGSRTREFGAVLVGTISTKDRRSGRIGSGSAVVTLSVVSSTGTAVSSLSAKM